MKVVLPKNYKKIFTVEEYEIAREVIKYIKNDDEDYTERKWVEYFVMDALKDYKFGWLEDIILTKAEICKNKNVNWDRYFEGSHDLDVFITILARVSGISGTSYYSYLDIGIYLSDIWENSSEDYKDFMIIEKYIKEEK